MTLALGTALLVLDKAYSKRERALLVWDKAVARVGVPSNVAGRNEGAYVPAPAPVPSNAWENYLDPEQLN